MVVNIFGQDAWGNARYGGFSEGIVYAADMGAAISSNSWGYIDAGVYDHCDSPKLTKIEHGWDEAMEREMRAQAPKKPIEKFASNCRYKYLLHIDGNVASSRLASELHVGSTIFKQVCPNAERTPNVGVPKLSSWRRATYTAVSPAAIATYARLDEHATAPLES